jgi:Delta3-Delta2-enoyl-CoA isomerase
MAHIGFERDGGCGVIRIDDGKANAMDAAFFAELDRAMDEAEASGCRGLVFAGRPGFFSGGLNVKTLPTLDPGQLKELHHSFAHTMARAALLPVPTAAACAGHAVAGGFILALACDLRLVEEGPFRLQMNEVLIGIALPSWVLAITQPVIPPQRHAEVLLHGKAYSPKEAVCAGLFDELATPGSDLVARAKELLAPLVALDPRAYALSKRRMRGPAIERALALLSQERLPGEAE